MFYSWRAKKLVGSPTMKLTLEAQEKLKNGEDVIIASVGEPDQPAPLVAKVSLSDFFLNKESRYGSAQGQLSTRKIVAQWMSELYENDWTSDNVLITPGSKFSLYALLQMLCDENCEVIIPSPYWVSYETLGKMSQAKIKIVSCNALDNYKLNSSKLKKLITNSHQVLILNSPQNPTGAVYSKEELKSIAQVVIESPNLLVICDDIYNQLIFSQQKRAPSLIEFIPKEYQSRVIIVHGASKSFAMTGWRLGWVMADESLIKKVSEFQSQTITCVPDFLQFALEKVLTQESHYVSGLKESVKRKYELCHGILKKSSAIKVYPSEGAFYVWLECADKSLNSELLAKKILTEKKIALVPGIHFGCEHHLRMSLTLPEESLQKVCEHLVHFFETRIF